MDLWPPGTTVIRRDRWFGRTFWAVAGRVIADDGERFTLWVPSGSGQVVPEGDTHQHRFDALQRGTWKLVALPRYNHSLIHYRAGDHHCVMTFWDESWDPVMWYVNFDEPYERNGRGFDTKDLQLDMVVSTDGKKWAWKDEDELAEFYGADLIDADTIETMRKEGLRVVDEAANAEWPFDPAVWDWRPDPSWPLPELDHEWVNS